MVKYAICGDIHWSTYSSILRKRGRKYSQRLNGLIKSVNWFENLSKKNKCDGEIFLGDTLDRPDLNAEEITALQDVKWNTIPKYFIVGNHESNINTLEYSSTKFFESIDASVVSSTKKIEINDVFDFYLIPYITSDKIIKLKKYIDEESDKKKIVFAHQDIAGIQYGRFTSQSGFEVDDILDNCELFFDGHLHNAQVIRDKIYIAGILTGQNFNEDALKSKHYAYILTINDDGSASVESFVNPEAFNFYKLRFETSKDLKILDTLDSHSVVSAVCEEKLNNKLIKKIKENKNIVESRVVLFYDYAGLSGDETSMFVDDYIKQFILLAKDKIENSIVLDKELARLGGD